MNFLKDYGDTEGPLGLPCSDSQAKALEEILKPLDNPTLERVEVCAATTELMDGERADVSWISTEDIDRARDIVIARGIRDDFYQLNPVVTLNHQYSLSPVGR